MTSCQFSSDNKTLGFQGIVAARHLSRAVPGWAGPGRASGWAPHAHGPGATGAVYCTADTGGLGTPTLQVK